ncbi:major facilitator superfamily domain-containing protein, partial [Obelidium mucronatum]
MPFLIAGRVIAGLGGGGIFTLSYVIISDIVSARDRGKYQTVITITYGGASCIAPLLGGVFADFASWRWSFYINLPFGFIAIATALIYMNFPTSPGSLQEKLKRIDVLGVILLFSAVACLVAGLQLGGSSFPWSSAPIISLFTISVILTLALMYVELKVASEPVIPASIFVNSSVPAILIAAFCLGGVFFAGLYYITLLFQVIYGDSSTEAGVKSIAFVAGFILCSVCTGFMVSKTGRYKIFFHIGSVIVLAGTVLTSTLNPSSTLIEKIGYLFVFGLGAGVLTSVRMLAVQLSVPTELIAVASAVTQTMGTLGGSVGVAIAGTIFNNYLSEKSSSLSGLASAISELNGKGYSVSPADVLELSKLLIAAPPLVSNPTAARLELTGAFASAFRISYLSLLVYPCLILAMTLFIREFSIKAR